MVALDGDSDVSQEMMPAELPGGAKSVAPSKWADSTTVNAPFWTHSPGHLQGFDPESDEPPQHDRSEPGARLQPFVWSCEQQLVEEPAVVCFARSCPAWQQQVAAKPCWTGNKKTATRASDFAKREASRFMV